MIEYMTVWESNPASFEKVLDVLFDQGWEPVPDTLHIEAGENYDGFIIVKRSEERKAVFND